jgi:c-di-GMP-binding flagellar brake protein YcgR
MGSEIAHGAGAARAWSKGDMMNDVTTPRGVKPGEILRIAIDKKIPAIMSYLSKGKWHVAKILLTGLDGDRLRVESMIQKQTLRPINIQVNQPVGLSFKYEHGKFVFDTTVQGLEPSHEQQAERERGGTIVLAVPDEIEVIQRRNYFRVNVPESLKVKVLLWHRSGKVQEEKEMQDFAEQTHHGCQGRLMDISAGGAQVIVPTENLSDGTSFKKGQFIGMRFTPLPYETPVVLCAQIRNTLPTADGTGSSLGMQIVGLEASCEGRKVLTRLISIVERYYQINQQAHEQPDAQPVANAV